MRNHTEAFTQLVQEQEKKHGVIPKSATVHAILIDDTFIEEAVDLYKHVVELRTFLVSVKSDFLLSDAYSHKAEGKMTEEERDQVDLHARLELQKSKARLDHLKNYEKKRSKSKQFFAFNKSQSSAVNNYRGGVLSSLNYQLEETTKLLLRMEETRLSRKRDIELNDFDNRTMKIDFSDQRYNEGLFIDDYQPELQDLSQEQVQLLETENSEILDAKLEELAKVEQIQSSVIEIAQLHAQLSSHLSMQSESIRSLVNEQDMIELDVSEANKQLKRATGRGNYATKLIMLMAILMGLVVLVYDQIHW